MSVTVCTSAIKLWFNPCNCNRVEGGGLIESNIHAIAESGWPICSACGDDLTVGKCADICTSTRANSCTNEQVGDMANNLANDQDIESCNSTAAVTHTLWLNTLEDGDDELVENLEGLNLDRR